MADRRRILIIDDDEDYLTATRAELGAVYEVSTATSIGAGLAQLGLQDVDLVLLDVGLDGENGIEGIRRLTTPFPRLSVAMLSGDRDVKTVVEAIRAGAVEYLVKPVDVNDLVGVVERAIATRTYQERCDAMLESQPATIGGTRIVYRGNAMRCVMEEASRMRLYRANVLIIGETGTGKELVARYLNEPERGKGVPFVAVNCAAIPEHLLESELFGHEAGAFTSAHKRRIGKFELADGGDIFLDEISTMKADLQVKLLRVLQEKEFCRLGGNESIKADFRVIAASNQPLEALVMRGEFRQDLYHRLRVVQMNVPPLRERVEDIPLLVEHFLNTYTRESRKLRITEAAMARLMEYTWPGNVRELANVIQSLTIMATGDEIDVTSFPPWIMNGCQLVTKDPQNAEDPRDIMAYRGNEPLSTLREYVQRAEKGFIERILMVNHGDKSKTARTLGLGRTTLYQKLKEHGLMK